MMDIIFSLLDTGNDTELARLLGVSPSTVGRWKRNPEAMPLTALRKLARIRGYTLKLIRKERVFEI